MTKITINGIKITVDTLHGDQQPFECDQCGKIIDYSDKVYFRERVSAYFCSIKCVKESQKFKRRHVAITDNDVIEIIDQLQQWKFHGSGYPQKFHSFGDFLERCVLYCKHNNIIQKEKHNDSKN